MVTEKLYKLVHNETGAVSWFTDSDELFHTIEWYEGQDYDVYEYHLVQR